MNAEGDPRAVLLIIIKPLKQAAIQKSGLKIQISHHPKELPQLKSAKGEALRFGQVRFVAPESTVGYSEWWSWQGCVSC